MLRDLVQMICNFFCVATSWTSSIAGCFFADRSEINSSSMGLLEQLSPLPYLGFSVAFIVLVHLLHTYLDVRQLKAIQLAEPPAALAGEHTTVLALCTPWNTPVQPLHVSVCLLSQSRALH